MIKIDQFDGQFTKDDVAAMNEEVALALAYHQVDPDLLTAREYTELRRQIEGEVSGHYDPLMPAIDPELLLSAPWRRLLAARRNDPRWRR